MYDASNELFGLAADIVLNTSRSVFLSGNAGTGKTTFLKYIRDNADKRLIVAAPTGVAAINAGGVTLHSLFQLPFEPFTPNYEGHKLLNHHVRFHKSKINLLRELELLIIDEVSMLRADMLDAIDSILKRFRNNPLPFGGVQMLFIGDLYQLPPVLKEADEIKLSPYYQSPFFFHAHAMNEFDFLPINLKKIYRQEEQTFIHILNKIRHANASSKELDELNKRIVASDLSKHPGYILLTTHNYKVDQINNLELARLAGEEFLYIGQATGDFPEHALPTDKELRLKKGARVMFTKNDSSDKQAYYNGKTGIVEALTSSSIVVHCSDGSRIKVAPEVWKNIRYTLDAESGEIRENEAGTYSQYPLRLAWAITIHKSQGLTFEKAAIDVEQAFSAGQVYVALSRCQSLEGLILFSPITQAAISTNHLVSEFSARETAVDTLKAILANEKTAYCSMRLIRAFDWQPVINYLESWLELLHEKDIPGKEPTIELALQMIDIAREQQIFSLKFRQEIDKITSSSNFLTDEGISHLRERTQKAVLYFHQTLWDKILLPLDAHILQIERKARVKLYTKKTKGLREGLAIFSNKLETIRFGNLELMQELTFEQPSVTISQEVVQTKEKKTKSPKGASARISLELLRQGYNIRDIAAERNMATSTIEGHLADMIAVGEAAIHEVMNESRLNSLEKILSDIPINQPLSNIKQAAGKRFSYGEIKFVLAHMDYSRKNT